MLSDRRGRSRVTAVNRGDVDAPPNRLTHPSWARAARVGGARRPLHFTVARIGQPSAAPSANTATVRRLHNRGHRRAVFAHHGAWCAVRCGAHAHSRRRLGIRFESLGDKRILMVLTESLTKRLGRGTAGWTSWGTWDTFAQVKGTSREGWDGRHCALTGSKPRLPGCARWMNTGEGMTVDLGDVVHFVLKLVGRRTAATALRRVWSEPVSMWL